MTKWLFLIIALTLNALANLLLKVGAKVQPVVSHTNPNIIECLQSFINGPTIWGIFLFAVNVLVYRKALESLNVSVAYPIMVSGGLILVTLLASLTPHLKEKMTIIQLVGMMLISLGICLMCSNSMRNT